MDIDLPIGDGYDLPDPDTVLQPGAIDRFRTPTSSEAVALNTSPSAVAPFQRNPRIPKIIPLDAATELTSRDLREWTENYLQNMAEKAAASLRGRAPSLAKRNAHEWTLGGGIASIATGSQRIVPSPLNIFHGALLYEAIAGVPLYPSGIKRPLDDTGVQALDLERHVRPRMDEEEQVGRGEDVGLIGEGMLLPSDEVEMLRETAEGLEDVSSAMPWNITASIRGSSAARQRLGSVSGLPFSQLRESVPGSRGQRLVSASPLSGRGAQAGLVATDVEHFEALTSDQSHRGDLGGPTSVGYDDFETYVRAAEAETRTAAQLSWQKGTLDQESNNFRDFLEHAIEERRHQMNQSSASRSVIDSIAFEELLNPRANSTVVAARALLQILTLASQNMIKATQSEAYGQIELRLAPFLA